ncbi:MAG: cation transporter [Candidatus Tectomicrobia bacterium]|uniref:Cation transporter n=1 Tax=Tectimicrobiota bacterium TaxID=2528274 RepID=A0A937W236_UNCTE|nr:cation transporter [Candidatus Tectomicrobia bacterium]
MEHITRIQRALPLAAVLFAFWIVLSGKFDPFHLLLGIGSALGVSLGTRRLLLLPPALGPQGATPWSAIPWGAMGRYLPWLLGQIVLSSLQVAYVVLHPKMPIQPQCIRFQTALPHTLARLTLATSITLTPGTITLDLQDDTFVVHALTDAAARALDPPTGHGAMQRWVAALYTAPASRPGFPV